MIFKIIDGITKLLCGVIVFVTAMLGIYAAYQIVFNMEIPVLSSLSIIAFIFTCSYFATGETPEIEAVPIMIVDGGSPANISGWGGGK